MCLCDYPIKHSVVVKLSINAGSVHTALYQFIVDLYSHLLLKESNLINNDLEFPSSCGSNKLVCLLNRVS